MSLTRQKAARIALPVLLVCIYGTLGVVRDVTNWLRDHELLRLTVGALFTLTALGACVLVAKAPALRNGKTLGVLGFVGAVYAAVIWPMESIEEKVHFIEYGVVALLALEAMPLSWRPVARFFAAALFVTAAGWADEGLQGLLPSRYYDLRDVAFNAAAGIMALSTISLLRWIATRQSVRSVKSDGVASAS